MQIALNKAVLPRLVIVDPAPGMVMIEDRNPVYALIAMSRRDTGVNP